MHEGTGDAPLLVRASNQSPEKIARRLSKFSGSWSEIGADPWVMRIVQWGYKIPFVTLPPHLVHQRQETTYPKGSLKWSSLNQSVQELWNKGAIEPAPLTPGFYSHFFLVTKATGEWRPITDLSSLNVNVHCLSFTMETPRSILGGPTTGPVVNIPRPERCLLSYRDQPSRQMLPTLLSQQHRMAVHSTAIQVVNQSESIYQNTQTGSLSIYAHLHRVNCTCTSTIGC